MPEATTLYSVTGVVLVGLVAWVVMVLKQAKEPWARPAPEEPAQELDSPEEKKDEPAETTSESAKLDADDTARATPVALSEGRQKAADEKKDEADDEPAAEEEAAKDAAKKEEA